MKRLNFKELRYIDELLNGKEKIEDILMKGSKDPADLNREIVLKTNQFLAKIRRYAMNNLLDQEFSNSINTCYQQAMILMESSQEETINDNPDFRIIQKNIFCSMESILKNLESNYSKVLEGDQDLPLSFKRHKLADLQERFTTLKKELPQENICEIFVQKVLAFTKLENAVNLPITRRSVGYMEELIRRLGDWDLQSEQGYFTALEKFLVYVNFNSKQCMDIILSGIAFRVRGLPEGGREALICLLDIQKDFIKLHHRLDIALNPDYTSIHQFLLNFLESEISFCLTAIQSSSDPSLPIYQKARNIKKLTCNLSADQISIILRLLDEERVVDARSLNQVYSTIIPYLNTTNRNELSPNSVRIKSYHPEERDIKRVKETLQGLLERANRY